ncbi:MAG TPA: hypothetical protein PKA63_02690 [Oligoflexia bacterium]|nr:hypothetical protein [Oligoflexia bacterium]HMP47560.1 hypothetical protein [Oligoflexia bacterium]
MYLGLIYQNSTGEIGSSGMYIFPEKVSPLFSPIPVSKLITSSGALFFISPEEAFKVEIDNDGAVMIIPFLPSKLYLTPNRNEKPGFSVSRAKVFCLPDGNYRMFFDRDKGWEEYTPLVREY